MQACATNYDG
jgi:hypothetical protein